MKTKLLILSVAIIAMLSSCANNPEGDQASVSAAEEAAAMQGESMSLDLAASTITFLGTKPVGEHYGTFKVSEGALMAKEGKVVGGEFTIDITSLQITDEGGESYKENLEGHLLSEDFFKAEEFPAANFVITSVTEISDEAAAASKVENANYLVSGNLTLRDTTNNITFPARIEMGEEGLRAVANFNIDRTWWKMHYGNDQSLGDKFIRPEVNIGLDIVAK
jgi:polyisoprenoid-binding protein YceI